MSTGMIGIEYLSKLWGYTTGGVKKLFAPMLKDGIGDKMDKGNLWIVPGFTLLAFAVLWTTKLSNLALAEANCRTAIIYDLRGTKLDEDAQRHCLTAKRYYVGVNEKFLYDQAWRERRTVKNPEWVLWFWAPIVFVMYVLTRYIWTLLMENQGINFENVVNASRSVMKEKDGIKIVDEKKLMEVLPAVTDNFRSAFSTHAFAAFIVFECTLVFAPLFLLLVLLPIVIGGNYRTWGLDVMRAIFERKEWQGVPLTPFFGSETDRPNMALIPRVTYCDYHFNTLGNPQTVTYRCYVDATWLERTALFTWIMLVLLTIINLLNLFFWALWAIQMHNREQRRRWVMKKWLFNGNGFFYHPKERQHIEQFAAQFKMGNLLLFYYIEAHTDRTVARTFANYLYTEWLDQRQKIKNSYIPTTPTVPETPAIMLEDYGWKWANQSRANGYARQYSHAPSAPDEALVQGEPSPPYKEVDSTQDIQSMEMKPLTRGKREAPPEMKKGLASKTVQIKSPPNEERQPLKKNETSSSFASEDEDEDVTEECK